MKKYNTKPIDFTGCHPVIAEALKRSEAIECLVWDKKGDVKREVWICRYKVRPDFPYLSEAGVFWKHAEPMLRKVRRIMPPERAIPVLIAEGWRFDARGALSGEPYCIVPQMFAKMGLPLEDNLLNCPDCIIEEGDE